MCPYDKCSRSNSGDGWAEKWGSSSFLKCPKCSPEIIINKTSLFTGWLVTRPPTPCFTRLASETRPLKTPVTREMPLYNLNFLENGCWDLYSSLESERIPNPKHETS